MPAHWGDMRQHVWYGALYHWHVMFRNGRYRHFKPHRALPVTREFQLHLSRLLLMPFHWLDRQISPPIASSTAPTRTTSFCCSSNMIPASSSTALRDHERFPRALHTRLRRRRAAPSSPCFQGPSAGGRPHAAAPRRAGTGARAWRGGSVSTYVRGGKLAALLDHARSAVTVNSTAGQQVLWRGLPIRAFGRAVFAKPEFVSTQPIAEFFAAPDQARQPRLSRLSQPTCWKPRRSPAASILPTAAGSSCGRWST